MKWPRFMWAWALAGQAFAASLSSPVTFQGMCDASAAVALDGDYFAVANDEDNLLRVYRLSQPGPSVSTHSLTAMLSGKRKSPESDLEGIAKLGKTIFCISSHGRNASGHPAPYRHRFFALELEQSGSQFSFQTVGKPYTNLVADLAREPKLARFRIGDAAKLSPKAPGGLNIEALTDRPDGSLLIGFRNPVPDGMALVVPLLNPLAVVTGHRPQFGDPLLLDLGRLGLRGMGSTGEGYFLTAGPVNNEAECRLFLWDGKESKPRLVPGLTFDEISPEGICFHDEATRPDFLLLSDDGTRQLGGQECKTLEESQRRFRAFRVLMD